MFWAHAWVSLHRNMAILRCKMHRDAYIMGNPDP